MLEVGRAAGRGRFDVMDEGLDGGLSHSHI